MKISAKKKNKANKNSKMSPKNDIFKPVHAYSEILVSYTRLIELFFNNRLFSEKDNECLKKIHQKIQELTILVATLNENTK